MRGEEVVVEPESKRRVDKYGRAEKGSQLQIQIYVNRRRDELDRAALEALPSLGIWSPRLRWVSPLEDKVFKEYYDKNFLSSVGFGALAPLLRRFWPARGPHWDALAVIERPSAPPGVLLVEAKSYAGELRGTGMSASSGKSRDRIARALRATQDWLEVPESARDAWKGSLYQTANRLAHLFWLRQIAGVDAWLLHVLFTGDKSNRATPEKEWTEAIERVEAELGLEPGLVPHAWHAVLRARKREELTLPLAESPGKAGAR